MLRSAAGCLWLFQKEKLHASDTPRSNIPVLRNNIFNNRRPTLIMQRINVTGLLQPRVSNATPSRDRWLATFRGSCLIFPRQKEHSFSVESHITLKKSTIGDRCKPCLSPNSRQKKIPMPTGFSKSEMQIFKWSHFTPMLDHRSETALSSLPPVLPPLQRTTLLFQSVPGVERVSYCNHW